MHALLVGAELGEVVQGLLVRPPALAAVGAAEVADGDGQRPGAGLLVDGDVLAGGEGLLVGEEGGERGGVEVFGRG